MTLRTGRDIAEARPRGVYGTYAMAKKGNRKANCIYSFHTVCDSLSLSENPAPSPDGFKNYPHVCFSTGLYTIKLLFFFRRLFDIQYAQIGYPCISFSLSNRVPLFINSGILLFVLATKIIFLKFKKY